MIIKIMSGVVFIVVLLMGTALALADEEAPNRPYAKTSFFGTVFAKCFPAKVIAGDDGETKGRTEVLKIKNKGEQRLCSFPWYSDQIYLAEDGVGTGDGFVLVKMGAWPRGMEPNDKWLAIAFYKGCREIRRYSTADIVRWGYKDPNNIHRSVSHYTVFGEVKGFRMLASRGYAFDIVTDEGTVLSFDTATGALRSAEDEAEDQKKKEDLLKQMCDESKGTLIQEPQKDGVPSWICHFPEGGSSNFGPVIYYMK